MSFSNINENIEDNIKNLQSKFNLILTSSCHQTAPEILNYIKYINNALDNIKLDYEFQRKSKDWVKQLNIQQIKSNETNIRQIISKGDDLAQQLNLHLHVTNMKNKELNQIREVHNWAFESLIEYLEEVRPLASGSYARLDNMAHHLGVTDRYIGYRNNLTRYGNQPVNVHTIWADRKLPQSSTPDWKNWSHAFQHNGPLSRSSLDLSSGQMFIDNQKDSAYLSTPRATNLQFSTGPTIKRTRSNSFIYASNYNEHLVKAGINNEFPGLSETNDRFIQRKEQSHGLSFPVAQPDYTSIGRPLSRLVAEITSSEYTHTFTQPDASVVEKYPWLRA